MLRCRFDRTRLLDSLLVSDRGFVDGLERDKEYVGLLQTKNIMQDTSRNTQVLLNSHNVPLWAIKRKLSGRTLTSSSSTSPVIATL